MSNEIIDNPCTDLEGNPVEAATAEELLTILRSSIQDSGVSKVWIREERTIQVLTWQEIQAAASKA